MDAEHVDVHDRRARLDDELLARRRLRLLSAGCDLLDEPRGLRAAVPRRGPDHRQHDVGRPARVSEAASGHQRPAARCPWQPEHRRRPGSPGLRRRVAAADRGIVDFALAAVVFAPALAVGSFLNVVAARVPLRRSIVRPPSACMSCGQELRWIDNVPLLSYALLRGRCRYCGVQIPFVYPAIEATTALLVAGCVLAFGV